MLKRGWIHFSAGNSRVVNLPHPKHREELCCSTIWVQRYSKNLLNVIQNLTVWSGVVYWKLQCSLVLKCLINHLKDQWLAFSKISSMSEIFQFEQFQDYKLSFSFNATFNINVAKTVILRRLWYRAEPQCKTHRPHLCFQAICYSILFFFYL